jgi:hypothetical protein
MVYSPTSCIKFGLNNNGMEVLPLVIFHKVSLLLLLLEITAKVVIYAQHRIDFIAYVACPLRWALELYISLFQ